ncbi:MAG: (2Fe-2S)-binding protein [Kineothrix sp.]
MNPEKIICPCRRVTKGQLLRAVEQGASSFKEVKKSTQVGKGCGKCRKKARKLTKKLLAKREQGDL